MRPGAPPSPPPSPPPRPPTSTGRVRWRAASTTDPYHRPAPGSPSPWASVSTCFNGKFLNSVFQCSRCPSFVVPPGGLLAIAGDHEVAGGVALRNDEDTEPARLWQFNLVRPGTRMLGTGSSIHTGFTGKSACQGQWVWGAMLSGLIPPCWSTRAGWWKPTASPGNRGGRRRRRPRTTTTTTVATTVRAERCDPSSTSYSLFLGF